MQGWWVKALIAVASAGICSRACHFRLVRPASSWHHISSAADAARFPEVKADDEAQKPQVMARQADLLNWRYELANQPIPGVMMSGGRNRCRVAFGEVTSRRHLGQAIPLDAGHTASNRRGFASIRSACGGYSRCGECHMHQTSYMDNNMHDLKLERFYRTGQAVNDFVPLPDGPIKTFTLRGIISPPYLHARALKYRRKTSNE